jgi:hypothetical protein
VVGRAGLTVSRATAVARLTRDRSPQSLKIIGINLVSWRAADQDVELFVDCVLRIESALTITSSTLAPWATWEVAP